MNGNQLFDKYLAKRDFSGSPADEYAQLLQTIRLSIGDAIFALLEQAETENKKLDVNQDDDVLIDTIAISDISFV